MEIAALVKKAKKGDKEALLSLVMEQKHAYYKLAYVYMKNKEDALDALEDMILVLYENIHRLRKEDAFYSWSKTILVNCCKKYLRRSKKIVALEEVEQSFTESYEMTEQRIDLEQHLERLGEHHQEVIRLHYFLDLDYQSIADLLKIPIGTVKSRLSIGIKRLKESFGGEV